MLGAIATTFEREMMLERQSDGIAKVKESGKYIGRKPIAQAKTAEAMELLGEGMTKDAVAARLNIGVASVYRIVKGLKTKTQESMDGAKTLTGANPQGIGRRR